jgi:hypothetical protein
MKKGEKVKGEEGKGKPIDPILSLNSGSSFPLSTL